jgi:hypothetical protein
MIKTTHMVRTQTAERPNLTHTSPRPLIRKFDATLGGGDSLAWRFAFTSEALAHSRYWIKPLLRAAGDHNRHRDNKDRCRVGREPLWN